MGSKRMEFFASDDQLAHLEAHLQATEGAARVPCLVALAWAVRQRDCTRALVLADEAEGIFATADTTNTTDSVATGHDVATWQALRLRLLLVRGEVKWLFGEYADGLVLAEQALRGFADLNLAALNLAAAVQGRADGHWLLAWLAYDQGNWDEANDQLHTVIELAAPIDPIRQVIAQAASARIGVVRDVMATKIRWGDYFTDWSANHGALLTAKVPEQAPAPAPLCWISDFFGSMANQSSDYANGIGHLNHAYAQGLVSGQMRRAITAAANIGHAFNHLNDFHAALDWMQRALALARSTGWPNMIGQILMQTADTLRRLQQYDSAHELLHEALTLQAASAKSRNYAITLYYLGDVELARKQYASALTHFQLLEQRASALSQPDLLCRAKRGQAQAWLELGEPEAALQAANAALANVGASIDDQIDALRVLADIYHRHTLAPPANMPTANMPTANVPTANVPGTNVALHYLQQALALEQGMAENKVPPDLYDGLAEQYAKQGDYQLAWEMGKRAAQARETIHSRETTNRALAMQLMHQAEREQAEDAHRRELASEAKRAEILQQTSDTLAHLGVIGQEITAHLDAPHVFEALLHHIPELFDASHFAVYLMAEDGTSLDGAFIHEHGQQLPPISIALNHPLSYAARCARERRAVMIHYDPQRDNPPLWVPGGEPTRSLLFGPLMLADRVLGVMTVQSPRANAIVYRAREELIFNALCSYTAIALSNAEVHQNLADAHRQLQETQQQLVLQGKMAGLGSLTAGVAHEINNPTNFVHVAAQNQRTDIAEFQQFVTSLIEDDEDSAVLNSFAKRFKRLDDNISIMLNGTQRIQGIVRDLRGFTRMDSEQKRPVRLSDCLISTLNLVRTSWLEQVEFITELESDPEIECWPALLNQVFMNLLVNGCQAIAERLAHEVKITPAASGQTGKLWLRLFQQGTSMVIEFQDSGIGMSAATQARIMEPFFTTKEVGQGTGLGLSIAFDIIQKHGGSIKVTSEPGHGSCFRIVLPLA